MSRHPNSKTAAMLRADFDASFASRSTAEAPILQDFLAIRLGAHPYAMRLSEISALHHDRKFVPIASHVPEFLGVAAFRGVLAPVFDLRSLLGYPQGTAPRWVVLTSTSEPVALAFDSFEAHLRVPREDVFSEAVPHMGARPGQVRGGVRTAELTRPLIHIASIIEALTQRGSPEGPAAGAMNNV
jgi:chemotaxis signal transduction protein